MSAAELDRRVYLLVAALLLTASALASAGLVRAEVVGKNGPTADQAEAAPIIHQDPVVLECWQHGRRVIREGGLRGLAVKAVAQKGTVAFKPMNGEQPEIFLLPFEDSLCLVAPED